ncbi:MULTISPECIES: zinc-ribbon domain-containing protein [unclassified Devosia]|jgi:predicted Zn finger-like uncharacterized protein|uniref:zinc-ribbon domain-containing protein n=1 Tax=unclassified Devosia TaxID=196773 RepID=UPI00086F482C|nr:MULTISPECIES: zinc-ribbon domain-containing protein [unclassified Devosia]MBN9365081.1 zinc-ribbon domain-containing protein [Devosia sp.]ODS92251.1 MAG: hypothetical protein ABS47_07455 [Devosia sp. SCN 66-27]OJX21084.1 MAG: hypothetical protein BGO83_05250 [Devosia sp. 66-14]
MRSPQPATVVIACPHCGTRYQVPPETLGPTGRKVSCAHCGKAWLAEAKMLPMEEDRLFTPHEEEALDREFKAIENRTGIAEIPASLRGVMPDGAPPPEVVRSIAEIKAAIAPKPAETPTEPPPPRPSAAERAASGKLEKRQRAVARGLPAARLFRMIRIAAVLLLLAVVAGGLLLRTEIVKLAPAMAGFYSAIGLGVNVVGLEFSEVSTLMSRRGDSEVISVTATIRGVEARRVVVPPVVVSLLDAKGASLYQWSVMPPAPDVEPGEAVAFSAELASPPKGATQLRLGFAPGRQNVAVAVPAATKQTSQETTH